MFYILCFDPAKLSILNVIRFDVKIGVKGS